MIRKFILGWALLVASVAANGQGTVLFSNLGAGWTAPVFDEDGVTRLAGDGYLAQLYFADAGETDLAQFLAAPGSVPFLDGANAGFFLGGTRELPGIAPGTMASVQVRVWEAAFGTTYEEALANGSLQGRSNVLTVTAGGAGVPPALPAALNGMMSFKLYAGVPPSIVLDLADQTVNLGQAVEFHVSADGSPPLSFEWLHNDGAIPGATEPLLRIEAAAESDVGSFVVIVSNAAGSVRSSVAELILLVPPVIVSGPEPTTVATGDTATLTVAAEGPAPIAYQWFRDGQELPGATAFELVIADAVPDDAGSYHVTVSNAAGSVTSDSVRLTVLQPPTIASITELILLEGTEGVFGYEIADPESPLENLRVTVSSSNSALLPESSLVLEENGSTGEVRLVPDPGQTGSAVVRVTVSDETDQAASTEVTIHVTRRLIRLGDASGEPGGAVRLPMILEAQGGEHEVRFSLQFDTDVFDAATASLGGGGVNGELTLHGDRVEQGYFGASWETTGDGLSAPGPVELFQVELTVRPDTVPGETPVAFVDEPVPARVADGAGDPLPAVYADGSVLIESGVEGDVAPRAPDGPDGLVTARDWIQANRFLAGLDVPEVGVEFRRLDTAPLEVDGIPVNGDGRVDSSDWVQIGRFALGLDGAVAAAGPFSGEVTSESTGAGNGDGSGNASMPGIPRRDGGSIEVALMSDEGESVLEIEDTILSQGLAGRVRVVLRAVGGEAGFGTSLTFNPDLIQLESVRRAADAIDADLVINDSDMESGRIGLLFGLAPGESFEPGHHVVLELEVTPVGDADSAGSVQFVDGPVRREMVDAAAGRMPARFVDGSVTLIRNDPPTLSSIDDQVTSEDVSLSNIAFTIDDPDQGPDALRIFVTSSDPILLPADRLRVSGAGASRLLTAIPAPNASGSATVTIRVEDDFGLGTETEFQITVDPQNDPPHIQPIADQTTIRGESIGAVPLRFGDLETAVADLDLSFQTSNPGLLPLEGFGVDGLDSEPTLMLTPADGATGFSRVTVVVTDPEGLRAQAIFSVMISAARDGRALRVVETELAAGTVGVVPVELVSLGDETRFEFSLAFDPAAIRIDAVERGAGLDEGSLGVRPGAEGSGQIGILLALPGGSTLPASVLELIRLVTVPLIGGPASTEIEFGNTPNALAIQDALGRQVDTSFSSGMLHILENAPPNISSLEDQSIAEDGVLGPLALTVTDDRSTPEQIQIRVSSSDPELFPESAFVVEGSGTERSLTVSPAPNRFGEARVVVTVTDAHGASTEMSFLVNVAAVNDSPAVSGITDVTVDEDAVAGRMTLEFSDVESAPEDLVVAVASDNPDLIGTAGIVLSGQGATRSLMLTPEPNQSGTATVAISVTDTDGETTVAELILMVQPVNDPPNLGAIEDQQVESGGSVGPISFRVSDLESDPGALTLQVASSNPALLPEDGIRVEGSGADRTLELHPTEGADGSVSVTLTLLDPDGGRAEVSFRLTVERRFIPPVIRGRVFHDVDGDGSPDGADPAIAGVAIEVTGPDSSVVTAFTGADGVYQVTLPTEGSYVVRALPEDQEMTATTPGERTLVLRSGDALAASFGFQRPGTLRGVVFHDSDRDGRRDANEGGVPEVELEVTSPEGTVIPVVSNAEGEFIVPGLMSGAYVVRMTAIPDSMTPTSRATQVLNVFGGLTVSGDFGLVPFGLIAGVVFDDTNGNARRDAGESGLSGIRIDLENSSGSIESVETDAVGRFEFGAQPVGVYGVRVRSIPPGFAPTTPAKPSIHLGSDSVPLLDFGFARTGRINGVVFDDLNGSGVRDAGEPGLTGARVRLRDGAGAMLEVDSGEDGMFEFTGLNPGSYIVRETDPAGYGSTTLNEKTVHLPAGQSARIHFGDQQFGTVSGTVFDDINGNGRPDFGEAGLAGVLIRLSGAAETETRTMADGTYAFHELGAGTYRVTETDPAGYTSTTLNQRTVNMSATGNAVADFGDQASGTISGIVFEDANGNGRRDSGEDGIGGVTVALLDDRGQSLHVFRTGGDGTFLFAALQPGAYAVRARDLDGFVSTTLNERSVLLSAGGSGAVAFGDQRIGIVSGLVFEDSDGDGWKDASEAGMAGVSLSLFTVGPDGLAGSDDDVIGAEGLSNVHGAYTFTDVDPGTYTVRQMVPDGFAATTAGAVRVVVVRGGSASANFGNQPTGTIGGSIFDDLNGNGVQDPNEPGIAGASVHLVPDEDAGASNVGAGENSSSRAARQQEPIELVTNGAGEFVFRDIGSGDYIVLYSPPGEFTATVTEMPVSIATDGVGTASFGSQVIGSITGVVFEDVDADGVLDSNEPGLGGVQIQLVGPGPDGQSGTDDDIDQITVTSGDGVFAFTSLASGDYEVIESDPDGAGSTTPNRVTVSLDEPAPSAVVRFGDRFLRDLFGSVFEDRNGDGIRNDDELGLPRFDVELVPASDEGMTDGFPRQTRTVGDGTFRFSAVPAGGYRVAVIEPDGYETTTATDQAVESGSDQGSPLVFGLRLEPTEPDPEPTVAMEIRMDPAAGPVLYATGTPNVQWQILASTDLKSWRSHAYLRLDDEGNATYPVPTDSGVPGRFFRLVPAAPLRLSLDFQAVGGTRLILNGQRPTGTWQIQVSGDLKRWSTAATVELSGGSAEWIDDAADESGNRFYRAIPAAP